MTTAMELIEARRLRDAARAIVRTDVAVVRLELAERSLVMRVRDRIVISATQTAQDGIALARDNRLVVGLTLGAVIGWLFRKPLGGLVQTAFGRAERGVARWRH